MNYVVVKLEDWFDTVSSDTYLYTYSGKLVIASDKGPMVDWRGFPKQTWSSMRCTKGIVITDTEALFSPE